MSSILLGLFLVGAAELIARLRGWRYTPLDALAIIGWVLIVLSILFVAWDHLV